MSTLVKKIDAQPLPNLTTVVTGVAPPTGKEVSGVKGKKTVINIEPKARADKRKVFAGKLKRLNKSLKVLAEGHLEKAVVIVETERANVFDVSKKIRAYVAVAVEANKVLEIGADELDLTFSGLQKHVYDLVETSAKKNESFARMVRRGIKVALLPVNFPKIFKALQNGNATAESKYLAKYHLELSETGKQQRVVNLSDRQTALLVKNIDNEWTRLNPGKGADEKKKKEAADQASINTSVEGITVQRLVDAINGKVSNGKASLKRLTLNELKCALAMAQALAQFQLDAKQEGHDNVTKFLMALIDAKQDKDPAAVDTS